MTGLVDAFSCARRDDGQDAAVGAGVVFVPEPGSCGGRVDPGQTLVPDHLVRLLDWHVWPSAGPGAVSAWARTVCGHVDYELVWLEEPWLFGRRVRVGVPPPEVLWDAKRALEELGVQLCFDVQLEVVDRLLALAVYGVGVVGRMGDAEWRAVAGDLTTCCAVLREPLDPGRLVRPGRRFVAGRRRPLPYAVQPQCWEVGDWAHTWWSYPAGGALRRGCRCSAHTAEVLKVEFGPGARP